MPIDREERPRAVDSREGCFPLPPGLRDEPHRYAAAIVALTLRLLPDAAPHLQTAAAGFLSRLFALGGELLPLVSLMFQREISIDRKPFLEEAAAALGLRSKQELKARLAFAVACCPELRAIFPRTRLCFQVYQEHRLAASLAAGATFPGKLERTPAGALCSPVGPARYPATIPPPGRTVPIRHRRPKH